VKNRIVLIDDDKDFVQATRELLETSGYKVSSAHDGRSGVEAARRVHPDLIILDVMMATDTEGFEVSQELQKIDELKGVPVILMTGIKRAKSLPFSFEPDEDWLPVKAVLEKPVRPEALFKSIEEALGG